LFRDEPRDGFATLCDKDFLPRHNPAQQAGVAVSQIPDGGSSHDAPLLAHLRSSSNFTHRQAMAQTGPSPRGAARGGERTRPRPSRKSTASPLRGSSWVIRAMYARGDSRGEALRDGATGDACSLLASLNSLEVTRFAAASKRWPRLDRAERRAICHVLDFKPEAWERLTGGLRPTPQRTQMRGAASPPACGEARTICEGKSLILRTFEEKELKKDRSRCSLNAWHLCFCLHVCPAGTRGGSFTRRRYR
jgi:hypothetical protein